MSLRVCILLRTYRSEILEMPRSLMDSHYCILSTESFSDVRGKSASQASFLPFWIKLKDIMKTEKSFGNIEFARLSRSDSLQRRISTPLMTFSEQQRIQGGPRNFPK